MHIHLEVSDFENKNIVACLIGENTTDKPNTHTHILSSVVR